MFITSPEMRLEVESAFYPGHDVWALVELPLAVPMLLVRLACENARQEVGREITVFAMPAHLAAFAAATGPFRPVHADLLLPPRDAGAIGWTLRRLDELWRCGDPGHPDSTCWLFLCDGEQHTDSLFGTNAALLVKQELTYRATPRQAG